MKNKTNKPKECKHKWVLSEYFSVYDVYDKDLTKAKIYIFYCSKCATVKAETIKL